MNECLEKKYTKILPKRIIRTFIFPSTYCIENFYVLLKKFCRCFFLLAWYALLIDYFQVVRKLLVFF